MAGGRSERGSGRPARAASAVVPFPRGAVDDRLDLARFVPSGRSLAAAAAIVAAAGLSYWGMVSTSVFAVEKIEVRGAPPAVQRQVEAISGDLVGSSLLRVDTEELAGRVRALPAVAGVAIDRAFPHSLVVKVAAERAVAVARRGSSSYLVTGSAKVVREVQPGAHRKLPRLWIPRGVTVSVGGRLPPAYDPATRALATAREVGFRRPMKGVRSQGDELVLVLRRGPEIRLGAATDYALKLTVAREVLGRIGSGRAYVDVSVPERPVAGW
ncbi:MAG TPA: FtsQ-type POTRA domain-containing protein [Gaiellaceae bacterium]|nr:FtsQ-type POTRA domain-containing protein [Gaiellaceae bacterium]